MAIVSSATRSDFMEALAADVESEMDLFGCIITRHVVILEMYLPGQEHSSIAHMSRGADGNGLLKWEAMGLTRAALIQMEHEYTHDE